MHTKPDRIITSLLAILLLSGCGDKNYAETDGGDDTDIPSDTTDSGTDTSDDTGTDESTDTGEDTDTVPEFIVGAGGYVTSGDWQGYAYTNINGDDTTISPENFSDITDAPPLCIEGTVGDMPDWSGNAQIIINVNQAEGTDAATDIYTPGPGGMYVDVTNPGDTELRVLLLGPNSDTLASQRWCYSIKTSGGESIPWLAFNTACWNNSGTPYKRESIVSVGIQVPGHNSEDRPYEFCLNSMYPWDGDLVDTDTGIDTEVDTGEPVDTDLIPADWNTGFVGVHGQIQTEGSEIQDQNGDPLLLRGLSLFWSQWSGEFYNQELVNWLVDDWNINLIRAALGVNNRDGYLIFPTREMEHVTTVVNAAIEAGIYVIIDWHDHNADLRPYDARAFFETMAKLYGDYPNVIYEIWNEPLAEHAWRSTIFPYAEFVIEGIREHDPDNLIVVGTQSWSQNVNDAAQLPLDDPNVAYTFHFYAGMHSTTLQSKANVAMLAGLPVFITEWGVWTEGYLGEDHNNEVDTEQLTPWLDWADEKNLSMAMWSVNDKDEPSAIIKPGAAAEGNWSADDLTTIGTYMRGVFNP